LAVAIGAAVVVRTGSPDRPGLPGADSVAGFTPGWVVAEEVSFRHAGDVLAGTLYGPDAPGPHPEVALVLGSGRQDRGYGGVGTALGGHFARRGFACLTWDKPGVGESTGDHTAQTFPDRAGEALVAVRFLRGRPDVRREWVGLWGHSQGGAVAPLAASLSADVGFVIAVAGWQGPAWEQDPVRVECELRANGSPEADVRAGVAFARRRMDLIRGAGTFEESDREQGGSSPAPGSGPSAGATGRCSSRPGGSSGTTAARAGRGSAARSW
jgi:pimeloyl-ACP methyl ester carboxylesterase